MSAQSLVDRTVPALVLSLTLALAGCAGTTLVANGESPLALGAWGGQGIGLVVSDKNAQIEFDCATAEMRPPLTLDSKGVAVFKGTFTPESFGPTREDQPPQSQAAKFKVSVTGDAMTLEVTIENAETVIGKYSLTRGGTARLRKCR